MTEYLQVFRVRVAEAQRLCPQLLRAELVRLEDRHLAARVAVEPRGR